MSSVVSTPSNLPLEEPGQEFCSLNYLLEQLSLVQDFGLSRSLASLVLATCDEPEVFVGDAGGWTDAGEHLPQPLVLEGRKKELQSWQKFCVVTEVQPSEVPVDAKVFRTRFLYTWKGDCVKARFVVQQLRRYHQATWMDVFASCPTVVANRLLLLQAMKNSWEVVQGDVSTAFLHAPLDADMEIYLVPPSEVNSGCVWKLHKAAYGLREAPRLWQQWYASRLVTLGFERCAGDPQFFVRHRDGAVITTHADDVRVTACPKELPCLLGSISKLMSIKWEPPLSASWVKFLGSEWCRVGPQHFQVRPFDKHLQRVIEALGLQTAKGVGTPKWSPQHEALDAEPLPEIPAKQYASLTGVLQWVALSCADIQFSFKELARNLIRPSSRDWQRLKKVCRYLKSTRGYVLNLVFDPKIEYDILDCVDASWTGDEGKSTSGLAIFVQGLLIMTASKTQSLIALSPGEAELYAINTSISESLFLRELLEFLTGMCSPIVALTDSTSAMGIISRQGSGRLKHIQLKYLWLQNLVREQPVFFRHVRTNENTADILTKSLNPTEQRRACEKLGLRVLEK